MDDKCQGCVCNLGHCIYEGIYGCIQDESIALDDMIGECDGTSTKTN